MIRIPVIPTIIVGAAIVTMVALGFWQLDRAAERDQLKRAMVERPQMPVSDYPFGNNLDEAYLYRRLRAQCDEIAKVVVAGGRDARGRTGWRQIATCIAPSGQTFEAQLGVADRPDIVADWDGGTVEGIAVLAPDRRGFWDRLRFSSPRRPLMIIAEEPKVGLSPSQRPDPANYENTSWGYAGQWFFFVLTALVIYILALRRRGSGGR